MEATKSFDALAYSDYRELIRDYYLTEKAKGDGFSFRVFSKRAGLRSPNHLKLVMMGERNLSLEAALRCAQAMNLTAEESTHLARLVLGGSLPPGADIDAAQDAVVRDLAQGTDSSRPRADGVRVRMRRADLSALEARLRSLREELRSLGAADGDVEVVVGLDLHHQPVAHASH